MGGPVFRRIGAAFCPAAIVAVALCASPFEAEAQTPSPAVQTVSGQVTDSSGGVIVGASVTLRAPSGGFTRNGASDARGRYRFDKVPVGSYVIDVFRDGFAAATRELRVTGSEPATLDIALNMATYAEEVTVSFTGEHAQTALKSDAPVRDIPLTVKSYTSSFIKAIDVKQASDLYTYMNGINRSGDTAYDVNIRGMTTTDPGGVQYNGFFGLPGRFASPNVENIERIEILKGPASVLYGTVKPGGLVNIITLRPQMERQHLFRFQTGTFFGTGPGFGDRNSFRVATDLTGPVGHTSRLLYRFNASYDNTKSFRSFVHGDEIYVIPSFSWNPSAGTILTVDAEYRKINGSFDDGLVAPVGDQNFIAPITTRYQEPDDFQRESGWSVGAYFTKLFSGGVNWNLNWRTVSHKDERVGFANQSVLSDNQRLRRRDRDALNHRRYNYLDTTVRKSVKAGSVGNTFLIGLNGGFEQSDIDQVRFPAIGFVVALLNPVYGQQHPAVPTNGTHLITNDYRLGAYFQDQIAFSPKWKGLASVRYDIQRERITEVRFAPNSPTKQSVGAPVPTAGLVFQPDNHWSIYGSYARSFFPAIASAVNIEGRHDFAPERGRQFEAGVKAEGAGGRIDATVSLFQIKKDNVLVPGETSGVSLQVGQERSRGVEFDLRLRPARHWQAILGYAYTEAKITEDTRPNMVGARLLNAPKHAFNVWSRYDVPSGRAKGLGFGIGLILRGDRAGSFPDLSLGSSAPRTPEAPTPSPVLQLPAYSRADVGVYYVRERYQLTLKVNNVFDKLYYESAFNVIRIRPGNPREATLSVRLRF